MAKLDWSHIKHFKRYEFECRCHRHNESNPSLPEYAELNYYYMARYFLDPLRKDCGSPIIVSGPYRCPEHNRETKGSSTLSYHSVIKPLDRLEEDIRPCAIDIYATRLDHNRFETKIQANTNINFCGYRLYTRIEKGKLQYFVHVDFRGVKARW